MKMTQNDFGMGVFVPDAHMSPVKRILPGLPASRPPAKGIVLRAGLSFPGIAGFAVIPVVPNWGSITTSSLSVRFFRG